ncbi:MAG TPA: hypothetical protein ENI23_09130 [bacterium]|nr:hypothetical protein [bacterium]
MAKIYQIKTFIFDMVKNKEADIEKPVNTFMKTVRIEESSDVQISTEGNFMFVSVVHYEEKRVKKHLKRK